MGPIGPMVPDLQHLLIKLATIVHNRKFQVGYTKSSESVATSPIGLIYFSESVVT